MRSLTGFAFYSLLSRTTFPLSSHRGLRPVGGGGWWGRRSRKASLFNRLQNLRGVNGKKYTILPDDRLLGRCATMKPPLGPWKHRRREGGWGLRSCKPILSKELQDRRGGEGKKYTMREGRGRYETVFLEAYTIVIM